MWYSTNNNKWKKWKEIHLYELFSQTEDTMRAAHWRRAKSINNRSRSCFFHSSCIWCCFVRVLLNVVHMWMWCRQSKHRTTTTTTMRDGKNFNNTKQQENMRKLTADMMNTIAEKPLFFFCHANSNDEAQNIEKLKESIETKGVHQHTSIYTRIWVFGSINPLQKCAPICFGLANRSSGYTEIDRSKRTYSTIFVLQFVFLWCTYSIRQDDRARIFTWMSRSECRIPSSKLWLWHWFELLRNPPFNV